MTLEPYSIYLVIGRLRMGFFFDSKKIPTNWLGEILLYAARPRLSHIT